MNVGYYILGVITMSICLLIILILFAFFPGGLAIITVAFTIGSILSVTIAVGTILSYIITWIIQSTGNAVKVIFSILTIVLFILFILFVLIPNLTFIPSLLTLLLVGVFFILFNLPNFMIILLTYIRATSGGLSTPAITSIPSNLEKDCRSFLGGVNSAMNFWLSICFYPVILMLIIPVPFSLLIAILVGLFFCIVIFRSIDKSMFQDRKSILGISSAFMPMSMIYNWFGLFYFIISLMFDLLGTIGIIPGALIRKMETGNSIGTIRMQGGIAAAIRSSSYSLGNFIYANTTFVTNVLPTRQINTTGVNMDWDRLMLHEEGHLLNLGIMGTNFQIIGSIDEAYYAKSTSWSEMLAHGNIPTTQYQYKPDLDVWDI